MSIFSIVATYQVMENYGAHNWDGEGECPTFWKAKGGHEVVTVENLTVEDIVELGTVKLASMAKKNHPECNEYFEYYFIDWSLVELNDELVKRVGEYMKSDNYYGDGYYDYIDISYGINVSEHAAKWAIAQIAKPVAA